MFRPCLLLAAGLAPLAIAASAHAQTPSDLRDLIGERGAGGETQMEARGYRFVRVNTVGTTKWSYWWNADRRQCVQIATAQGRYSAIRSVPADNCRQESAGRPDRPHRGGGGGRDSLTLICWGAGDKPSVRSGTDYMWNSRRHRYEPRSYVESGREGFSSAVQVELWGGDRGRIHLTGKLVPPIHSGGNNGWWDLYEVRMDRNRITARYRLNGINKPRVDIDRRSGMISIDGIEDFHGRCDAGDWGDNRNRF